MFLLSTSSLVLYLFASMCGIAFSIAPIIATVLCACTISFQGLTRQTIHPFALICFFLFGALRYHQSEMAFFQHDQLLNKVSTIDATITRIQEAESRDQQAVITCSTTSLRQGQVCYPLNVNILLFTNSAACFKLQEGQKLCLRNIICKHPKNLSFRRYLIKEKIWAVAHPQYLSYKILTQPHRYQQIINALKQKTFYSSCKYLSSLARNLYTSIFLGKKAKSHMTQENKHSFQVWGLSHYLARSGLHLMILVSILSFFLLAFPIPLQAKHICIALCVACYHLATFPSIAFIRALTMYALYIVCLLTKTPCCSLHILMLTCLATLIYNPLQLFFLDFQLSFAATFIIIVFYKFLQKQQTVAS